MNIFKEFRTYLLDMLEQLFNKQELAELNTVLNALVVEFPKDSAYGDLSTNVAMILAPKLKCRPLDVAEKVRIKLLENLEITKVDIAGPGFINITFARQKWQMLLSSIIKLGDDYGNCNIGSQVSVNLEYVSCNPTGPMHIGHARGAVYGDVLSNVLHRCGYEVVREFYINDAGGQIIDLGKSLLFRYQQLLDEKINQAVPKGLYPGDYLIDAAEKLRRQYGDLLSDADMELIKQFAVTQMMIIIKADLELLGIKHDVFFSEKTLHDSKKIDSSVEKLKQQDLVYQGTLAAPKSISSDEAWDERQQLLFRSSSFGDDQDRALQKADGSWTYFAAEIAYFQDKIQRGFKQMILILGADHGGYIKRSQAVVKALDSSCSCIIKTCQMVNYVQDGHPMKMSKRAGDFLTVKDIITLVGKDVIRFMMLTRRNDAMLDFDVAKVVEMSKDNPVFYVQYAHVRTCSILRNAEENAPKAYDNFARNKIDFSLITLEQEIDLIKNLAAWPKVLESSALFFEPHRIGLYLQSIAADFHSLWNMNTDGQNYRFITEDNLTTARLSIAKSVQNIIAQGLSLMGVEAINKM